MQRGFITIPILLLILLGTAVVGGTGYVAYNAGKSSTDEVSVVGSNPELNSSSTVLLENNSATSSEVASDSNVGPSISEDATQKIADLESEISDLKNQAVGDETVKTVSPVRAVENAIVQEEIIDRSLEVVATSQTEEVFDWKYWQDQEESLKESKKTYRKVAEQKEQIIENYEHGKDSYAKWSPLLKDTIAGNLASNGYSQLNDAISLEESAIKIINEYIDIINQVLDAIEQRDEETLKLSVSSLENKFEEIKNSYEDTQTASETASRNLKDFNDALESMGY